ncbi:hypothetical protein LSTR_LSTR002887, partial [Laodelphax striatellus]
MHHHLLTSFYTVVFILPVAKGHLHNTQKPIFLSPIGNITAHMGKEAVLTCAIENLGKHR